MMIIGLMSIVGIPDLCNIDSDECDNTVMYNQCSNYACHYVTSHDECVGESLINFYKLFFCNLNENYVAAIAISIVLMAYVFYALGSATQDYLALGLAKCANICGCSENLAGVTLLAAANGAQDLASSYVAAASEETTDESRNPIYLSIGALIGAAIFINLIITSVVTIRVPSTVPIRVPKMKFLKDVFFLELVLVCLLLYNLYGKIDPWMGSVFFVLYFLYVLTSIIFMDSPVVPKSSLIQPSQDTGQAQLSFTEDNSGALLNNEEEGEESPEKESSPSNFSEALKHTFQTILTEDYSKMGIGNKIFYWLLKFPCILALKLTIPPPDEETWDPITAAIFPLFSSLFLSVHFQLFESNILIVFIGVGVGVLYALLRLFILKCYNKPGKIQLAIHTIISLLMSGIWIWFLCNFVLDFLTLIGYTTEISSAYLGVTLLAMGNCVGDFIADLSIANLSYIDMAITGTYSSPTFNLMMGLGGSIAISSAVSSKGYIPFHFGGKAAIIPFFSLVYLIVYNLIFVIHTHFNDYELKRRFAYIGFASYAVFLVVVSVLAVYTLSDQPGFTLL